MREAREALVNLLECQCSDYRFSFTAKSSPAEWPWGKKSQCQCCVFIFFLLTFLTFPWAVASQDLPFPCPVFGAEEI